MCDAIGKRTSGPGRALVVLLPDPENGHVGRIVVSNPQGSKELANARASTRVTMTQAPRIRTLSESDVNRLFGEIIGTLPPPPRHFTLPFRFDSEELTEEGRKLLPDVLQAVKNYPVPEVVVIGHTDTTGTPQSNAELGLRRANAVRALLVQAGLDTGGHRRPIARRGRTARAHRRRRLRTEEPPRRSHGAMIPRILPRTRPRRLILLCGLVPTIVVAALSLYRPSVFGSFEYGVYDRLLRSIPSRPTSDRIVIVDVDERSLATVGQWPWRRDVIGTSDRRVCASSARPSSRSTSCSPNPIDSTASGVDAGRRARRQRYAAGASCSATR